MKIKILFDAGPLVNGNKTGVGRTAEGLLLALSREYPGEIELVGHYFNFFGRHKFNLPTAPNIRYRQSRFLHQKVVNMLRRLGIWIPFELLVKERGVFHLFPGFIGWPSLLKTPSAPFVHDITYIDYPQYVNKVAQYDLEKIMPGTVRRSSFIITNSESSKNGILSYYHLKDTPILVEYIPGVGIVSPLKNEADRHIKELGVDGPYLLFFGTIEPRKNLVGLLQAYEKLSPEIRAKYSLVLGGGKGWNDEEILSTLEGLKKSGAKIHQTGYVSDEQRAALFMNATIYLMPSHYEGFGMQCLEAMTYKTPMLLSDIPVLHEVAEESAVYCKTDPEDIAAKITLLINDKDLRKRLVENGTKRLGLFSWQKVAKEVFDQIKKVVS